MSLEVRDLALTLGARSLFSALSFSVPAGSALRVLGHNGAGKTSLLRVLCGLARPDAGEVAWQGTNIARMREHYYASLVYAGHVDALKNDLLAWENVAFGALLGGPGRKARALQGLDAMGLGGLAELPARALSQGQRKRVALARLALAPPASLWILDEPFNFLDAPAAQALCGMLERHCASGGTLIFTTHLADAVPGAATLQLGPDAVTPC